MVLVDAEQIEGLRRSHSAAASLFDCLDLQEVLLQQLVSELFGLFAGDHGFSLYVFLLDEFLRSHDSEDSRCLRAELLSYDVFDGGPGELLEGVRHVDGVQPAPSLVILAQEAALVFLDDRHVLLDVLNQLFVRRLPLDQLLDLDEGNRIRSRRPGVGLCVHELEDELEALCGVCVDLSLDGIDEDLVAEDLVEFVKVNGPEDVGSSFCPILDSSFEFREIERRWHEDVGQVYLLLRYGVLRHLRASQNDVLVHQIDESVAKLDQNFVVLVVGIGVRFDNH